MDSSTGTSSNSNAVSEQGDHLQQIMEEKKRKRMLCNRESARRSRARKQEQLDNLTARVAQLKKENEQMLKSLNVTSQNFLNVEADNAVLRAQADELTHRLESLKEIVSYLSNGNGGLAAQADPVYQMDELMAGLGNDPWNCFGQPTALATAAAASADVGFRI